MQCPQCQHENPPNVKFCHDCGTTLTRRCSSCQAELAPAVKFCGECGARVQPAAPTLRPAAAPELPPWLAPPVVVTASSPQPEPPRPRNRLAAVDWLLLGTLLPIIVFGVAMSVVHGVRGDFVRLPFEASSAPDGQTYPIVRRAISSPSAEIGFVAVGDRVLRLEESDLRGWSWARLTLRWSAAAQAAHALLFTIERDGVHSDVRVPLVPGYRWPGCPWWAPFPLILGLVGTALLLLVRATHWHLARRTYVVMLLYAAVRMPYFGLPTAPRLEIARLMLISPLVYGLTLWNLCEFVPSVRLWGTWQRASGVDAELSCSRRRGRRCCGCPTRGWRRS